MNLSGLNIAMFIDVVRTAQDDAQKYAGNDGLEMENKPVAVGRQPRFARRKPLRERLSR